MTTIAEDTGGRAFFDSNSFGQVFDRVVSDTSAYYVLGYSSTNPARDGRFRRIRVRLKRPDLKLEYRSGYYAPRLASPGPHAAAPLLTAASDGGEIGAYHHARRGPLALRLAQRLPEMTPLTVHPHLDVAPAPE